MRRRTFDILMAAAGLFLAVTLIFAGVMLTWAHNYIGNEVHTQLGRPEDLLPARRTARRWLTPMFAAVHKYGGKAADRKALREQAETYANHFIANHLNSVAGGKTYASGAPLRRPTRTTPPSRPRRTPSSRATRCAGCSSTRTRLEGWADRR